MRIILTVTNDVTNDRRVLRTAHYLAEQGHQVCIVGRKLCKNETTASNDAFQIKRMRLLFKTGVCFYAEFSIRLFITLLFTRFDTVTANDLDTLLPCFIIAKLRRKKIVYDSHELFTEVPELQTRPRVRAVWLRIERSIVPQINHTSSVCQSIAHYYTQRYQQQVSVIRNVPLRCNKLPHAAPIPNAFRKKKLILYQGTFNAMRGIEQAIEAMQWIDSAVLMLVGYGPLEIKLRELTQQLHLEQSVWFVGRIAPEHLYAYTQLAHIGLSIELDYGLNYRYALPNKMFDYIQCHVPSLVSRLPEMQQIIEKYHIGYLLESHNPKQIATQLTQIINNEAEWLLKRENCKKAALELCWENECTLLNNLYPNE